MPPVRSPWRCLLTILQIVMFVAFSVAGAGHSHAGPAHPVGHGLHPAVGLTQAAALHASDLSDSGQPTGDAASPCSLNCCCHVSLLRWDASAVLVSWTPDRTLAGVRTVAFDSVASETLPEPPRPFA